MGLLDDLEQEAQRRKAGQGDAERERQGREQAYKTQLEPGMQALYEYLTKLTQNLAYLKPKLSGRYEVPGYGVIVAYCEHDYELKTSTQPHSREITLNVSYTVATDECPLVEAVGPSKVKALNAVFQKHRLAGLQDFKKDDSGEMVSGNFRARGKVPLSVMITAEASTCQVRLNFTNFDALGTISKVTGPALFNEALFDEIGRYIAREPSNLFREDLPDDYRRQLQHKIQQEQMRRKWEQKLAVQQQEELERLKREKSAADEAGGGFFGKVKELFRKI
jgi:hypothetical protein